MRWLFLLLLVGCQASPVTIIHLANWHWISREDFRADQRNQTPEITDDEIDSRYAAFLKEIESFQIEQAAELLKLSQKHGVKSVFYEGVTDEDIEDFRKAVERSKRLRAIQSESLNAELKAKADALTDEMRGEILQLGTIGRLMASGDLEDVKALEDSTLLDAANPVKDGKISFDPNAGEAREDEMARRLLAAGPIVIVVLGGEHDLTDNLEKFSKPHKYQVIRTPRYLKLSQDRATIGSCILSAWTANRIRTSQPGRSGAVRSQGFWLMPVSTTRSSVN